MNQSQAAFDPMGLSPFFGFDASKVDYASTVDNMPTPATVKDRRGKIVNSANALTGQAIIVGGTVATRPIHNGEGWLFKTTCEATTGSVSDYNFIHNGSDFDIFLAYHQMPASAGNTRAILNNNGFSNTARGILLYYDNTSSLNALKLRIGNGTVGVISRDANNVLPQNQLHKIRVNKSGNTVTVYVNGVQVAQQTNTGWNTGDAVQIMDIFSLAAATARGWLNDLWVFNRSLNTTEAAQMDGRTVTQIAVTAIDADAIFGDSNTEGQAPNAGIASELNGTHNTLMFNMATAVVANSDYIERLQLAKNNKLGYQVLTQHGMEMRRGFTKANSTYTNAIFKFGQGSTDSLEWFSGTTGTRCLNALAEFYALMIATHRRKPVFKSITLLHGANDCQVGEGGSYETRMADFINRFVNQITTSATLHGQTGSVDVKLFFPRTRSGGAGFDATAYNLVVTAQTNMGNGSVETAFPAIDPVVRGNFGFSTEAYATIDTIHYDSAAYTSIAGVIESNY